MKHLENRSNRCHMIQLDKANILIKSEIPSYEAPPDFMMICATVLAKRFTIRDPEWIEEYPNAKEYVNVAFRLNGVL